MIEIKNKGKKPVIYIRYKDGKVLYIGETDDHRKGRPFREENEKEKIGDWDSIKLLNASKNVSRRRTRYLLGCRHGRVRIRDAAAHQLLPRGGASRDSS